MELVTWTVLCLTLLAFTQLTVAIKRMFIDKENTNKNRKDFVLGIMLTIIMCLMWIIVPVSEEITPITIKDDVITTVEISTNKFIVSGTDTLLLSSDTIVDTISIEMVSGDVKLNKEIKYTIFGEVFSRSIK